jgi:mannose-6-phosphate isomerase-like protein (cupin superfamily)
MIKRSQEYTAEVLPGRFGGKGEAVTTKLLTMEQLQGKGRLFARTLLKPGCSIGLHQHKGDVEAYYILTGEGTADDNGVAVPIKAGDVLFTADGQTHSLENTGTADLEYIALVLYC